jgi:hypothetical protein
MFLVEEKNGPMSVKNKETQKSKQRVEEGPWIH